MFRRAQLEANESETLSAIRDCTQKVGKTSVETTAYLRALGEDQGLNVDKHRDQVEKELERAKKGKLNVSHNCTDFNCNSQKNFLYSVKILD